MLKEGEKCEEFEYFGGCMMWGKENMVNKSDVVLMIKLLETVNIDCLLAFFYVGGAPPRFI